MDNSQAKPLSTAGTGEKVRLVRIEAGRGLKSRLCSLGLVPNAEITVVSDGRRGPIVISIKDSRLMLGRGAAAKIMVTGA